MKRLFKNIVMCSVFFCMINIFACITQAASELPASPNARIENGYTVGVSAGTIRYVQQNAGTYWYSGYWNPYGSGTSSGECYSACVSMALSYIGVHRTAGEIVSNGRKWAQPGASVESIDYVSSAIDKYIGGNGKYSPVVIWIPYTSGNHWVLVSGKVSGNTYLVVDPWNGSHGTTWQATISGNTISYWGGTQTIGTKLQYYNASASISKDTTTPIISNNTYYPACSSSHTSIVSALSSIGVDSSFSNRSNIASMNGISNYSGTSAQNIQMLNLLKQGRLIKSKTAVQADTTKPSISNIKISDVSHKGYTVSCTVTDNKGIDRVQFPTWTAYNDQDDIDGNWWSSNASRGSRNGNTYTFRVNGSGHNNEYGDYITHIYAFDTSGNYSSAAAPTVNVSDFTYNPGRTISDGIYNIVSTVNDNYELSIKSNSTDGGANVHLWTRIADNKFSKFQFTYVSDGYYRIKNVGSGLVLDVWGAGGSGSNLVQYTSHGGDNQLFRIYPSEQGGYHLVPKNDQHCCIDLEGGQAYDGNNVRMWVENYTKAESWKLIYRGAAETPAAAVKDQTIYTNSFIKTFGDKSFSLGASTSGDGKLSYRSDNTKVAKVSSGGKVTVKGIGTAKITITASATSSYKKASKTITVTVRPKGTSLSYLRNMKSKKLTITWKRNATVNGYKFQVSEKSSFSNAKTYTVWGNRTVGKTISVRKGKTYYVRIATYKGSLVSSWSKTKKIKINK